MFDAKLYSLILSRSRQLGVITAAAEHVGNMMLRYVDWQDGSNGYPSMTALAIATSYCTRHVGRCLKMLRDAGFVSWIRRRVRWDRNTTNLYALHIPDVPPIETKRAGIIARKLGLFKLGLLTSTCALAAGIKQAIQDRIETKLKKEQEKEELNNYLVHPDIESSANLPAAEVKAKQEQATLNLGALIGGVPDWMRPSQPLPD